MSTNARINLMATALVVIALTFGSALGYFALGGQPTPSDAVVPTSDTCMLCVETVGGSGGGGGTLGDAPSTPPSGLMTGTGGSGGGTNH